MKKAMLIIGSTLIATCFVITDCCSQTPAYNSTVAWIFVGSTPCSIGSKPLPGIPANADCELIRWNLILYRDSGKLTPSLYKLTVGYGMSKPNTTGFIAGGSSLEMQGSWTIIKGTRSNPSAEVYQLDTGRPGRSISFLKLDHYLLHLLDSDGRLMIGNAAWSYTLNRLQ